MSEDGSTKADHRAYAAGLDDEPAPADGTQVDAPALDAEPDVRGHAAYRPDTPSEPPRAHAAYRPDAPSEATSLPPDLVYQEAVPPEEHTRRVEAARAAREPSSKLEVHDAPRSTTELASPSRRQLRRERDRRAERTAIYVLFGGFGALAAIAYFVLSSDWLVTEDPAPPTLDGGPIARPTKERPILSAPPEDAPRIAAIGWLEQEGMTIAAEGLPRVRALTPGAPPALVGVETCRFAFAVWEFSPNQMFRFFTTCPPLAGQSLVGAYEIRGSKVVMSPLSTPEGVAISSVFEVERPSKMVSVNSLKVQGMSIELEVAQQVTSMRPGLHGAEFVAAFGPKNTLLPVELPPPTGRDRAPPAPRPTEEPEAPPAAPSGDPVLELLRGR